MRPLGIRASRGLCLPLLCGLLMLARPAAGQTVFPQTLHWGSGLIDIPTAWVSQENADFAISYGLKGLQTSPVVPEYTAGSVQWAIHDRLVPPPRARVLDLLG